MYCSTFVLMLRRVFRSVATGFFKQLMREPTCIILVVKYRPDRFYFVTDCAADKIYLYKMRLFASRVATTEFVYNVNHDHGPYISSLISIYNPKRKKERGAKYEYGKLKDIPLEDKRCGDLFKKNVRKNFDLIIKHPAIIV